MPGTITSNPPAVLTRVGQDGWNAEDPFWQSIPGPQNVLEIPSKLPVHSPIVAQPQDSTALKYLEGECCLDPEGQSVVLLHDALSGWWFPFFAAFGACVQCDPVGEGNTGCTVTPWNMPGQPAISVHDYIILMMRYADGPYSPFNIPLLLNPDYAIDCSLPAWLSPSGSGACNFDFWTVACADSAIEIEISIGDNTVVPNQPPPDWCRPPGMIVQTSNGAVCKYDPYIPLPFPREFARARQLQGMFSSRFRERPVLRPNSPSMPGSVVRNGRLLSASDLNVAGRLPLPNRIAPIGCGCGTPDDYEESLDGN